MTCGGVRPLQWDGLCIRSAATTHQPRQFELGGVVWRRRHGGRGRREEGGTTSDWKGRAVRRGRRRARAARVERPSRSATSRPSRCQRQPLDSHVSMSAISVCVCSAAMRSDRHGAGAAPDHWPPAAEWPQIAGHRGIGIHVATASPCRCRCVIVICHLAVPSCPLCPGCLRWLRRRRSRPSFLPFVFVFVCAPRVAGCGWRGQWTGRSPLWLRLCPLAHPEGRRPISCPQTQRRSHQRITTHQGTTRKRMGERWIEYTKAGTLNEGQNRMGGCIIKAKDARRRCEKASQKAS